MATKTCESRSSEPVFGFSVLGYRGNSQQHGERFSKHHTGLDLISNLPVSKWLLRTPVLTGRWPQGPRDRATKAITKTNAGVEHS